MKARLSSNGLVIRQNPSVCISQGHHTIPFSMIIDAEAVRHVDQPAVGITFVDTRKNPAQLNHEVFRFGENQLAEMGVAEISTSILENAYPRGRTNPRFLVIVNPHGGQKRANELFERFGRPVLERCGADLEVVTTTYAGHARCIARELNHTLYDAILCVSGDGLPHEVLNGLMERHDASEALRLAVGQLPGGSGNAMCLSLNGTLDFSVCAVNAAKAAPMAFDLMLVTQKSQKYFSFLSTSYGIVADCDLGTEHLRWMGPVRFTAGLIWKALQGAQYPCKLYCKRAVPQVGVQEHFDNHESSEPDEELLPVQPKYGTVDDPLEGDWDLEHHPSLSLFFLGKMPYMSADSPVFPYALPSDGTADLLTTDSRAGRVGLLRILDGIAKAAHLKSKQVRYEKIEALRLEPTCPNHLSVDGESYACEPIQIEVIPRAAYLWSPSGRFATELP